MSDLTTYSTPEGATMPGTVRAKMRCSHFVATAYRTPAEGEQLPRTYHFQAVYDMSVPEDQRYAKSTPSAGLQITVDNPAVSFEPGKSYYLDFTPADE